MARSLSDISTTRTNSGLRAAVYGPNKVGKSSFAAGAPNPIFIPTEDGLAGLNDVPAFPLATDLREHVYASIGLLANESHDYKTVVIDSLDWMEPLVWEHVCRENKWQSIESPGYGKGYVEAAREYRQFLDGTNALIAKGMNVVLICHDAIKRIDPPEGDGYDCHVLKLHQRAAGLTLEWADVVGFASHRIATRKSETGFGNSKTKAISTGERILKVESAPAHCGGNRFGLKDCPLEWGALTAALAAPTTKEETA